MKVSVDVGYVDVDVDTDDYDSDTLITELESRGFEVLEINDPRLKAPKLMPEEFRMSVEIIDKQSPPIGSDLYFLREKMSQV